MLRNQKGFTLIELLIVIAVLGILAAVVVPNLIQFIGKGKVGAANAELGIVNTALQAGMADSQVALVTEGSISNEGQTGGDEVTIGNYIQGDYEKLNGIYYFNVNGFVTDASYEGVNFVSGKFE